MSSLPVDLVGVNVPVLENVPADGLQVLYVAVEGLTAHLSQLLQNLRLNVARHLTNKGLDNNKYHHVARHLTNKGLYNNNVITWRAT